MSMHLTPDHNSLNIFVVENDADTLKYLRIFLERSGHAVRTAVTVSEALEKLPVVPCDVLISDIGLPDGDGWELMERAQLPESVYAIAMSGYGMGSDKKRSQAVGYRHHLLKPFDPGQLKLLLEEARQQQNRDSHDLSKQGR